MADSVDRAARTRGQAIRAERRGEVVRRRPLDLADEAQRQVQVLLVDPARALDSLHRVDQPVAHGLGRADGDEQAVRHAPANGNNRINAGTAKRAFPNFDR